MDLDELVDVNAAPKLLLLGGSTEQAEHFRSRRCSKVYHDLTTLNCTRPCFATVGADISEVTSRQSLRGDR